MKKNKKKVVKDKGITMKIDGNRVKLEGAKIKEVKLVPHWQIKTIEETVPMYNNNGEVINVASKFTKESTVTFYPDIEKEKEKK